MQGSGGSRVSCEGHDRSPLFGLGKSYHRNDAERLGHLLVLKHVLAEHMVIGNHDNVISYVKLGPKALDFLQSRVKVLFIARLHGNSSVYYVTPFPLQTEVNANTSNIAFNKKR